MRRSSPAYPAVGEGGRTQPDDNWDEVIDVFEAGWPGMGISRPYL